MLVPFSSEIPPEAGILTGTVDLARVARLILATRCTTSVLGWPR
jgi:hypothetical protein